MTRQDLLDQIRRGADNDALMLSLPELSRETGIPMPVILRLKREHPDELPSVGAGSQQSFPQGVIPILRRLHRTGSNEESAPAGRPLLSLTQRRRAARRGPAVVPAVTGVPSLRTETGSREESAIPESAGLAARFRMLAERQDRLAGLLAAVLAEERRGWGGVFSEIPRGE